MLLLARIGLAMSAGMNEAHLVDRHRERHSVLVS
jgi:hypothetical protein